MKKILLIFALLLLAACTSPTSPADALEDTPALPEEPSLEEATTPPLEREIKERNGVKYIVDPSKILGGGPPKDGIPSIDNPKYVSQEEADEWIQDNELVLAIEHKGVKRIYPLQIMVWHEIVNDVIEGDPILITYCPLCGSGIAYERTIDGEAVEFGTSGKLYNSNLVMYDRKTDSLWSQILGEAILGEQTGVKLAIIESNQMRFGEWREAFPNGEVLSRDTGSIRPYGTDPYGDYYTNNREVYFPVEGRSSALENKDFVLGVEIDGKAKAYYPPAIAKKGEIEDEFNGVTIVARHDRELDVVKLFTKNADGSETPLNPVPSFWFAWVGAYPDTELYK